MTSSPSRQFIPTPRKPGEPIQRFVRTAKDGDCHVITNPALARWREQRAAERP